MDTFDAFDADLSGLEVPADVAASNTVVTEGGADSIATQEAQSTSEADVTDQATTEQEAGQEQTAEEDAAVKQLQQAADKGKPTPRQLQFMVDGKPLSLVENAETEWKVDGKTEKVKLRDLLDNYAGKVSYDRKFNEFSQQRKGLYDETAKFNSERERHKNLILDMHKATKEGRVFDAVANMLEMTGTKDVDARAYISDLRAALMEHAKALAGLSPQERALQEKQEELDYTKQRQERDNQRRAQEEANTAFRTRVTKEIERAKATTEDFVQAKEWLVQKLTADKLDVKQVTPEFVADYLIQRREYESAKAAMDEVDPELTKNQKLWRQTVELMRLNPHWTKDDVKGIVRSALGGKRAKNVNKKLSQAPVATVAKGAAKSNLRPKNLPVDVTKEQYSASDLDWS